MLTSIVEKLSVRSVVVLLLVSGSLAMAVIDKNFRPAFADLVKIGVGGYLAQLIPKQED